MPGGDGTTVAVTGANRGIGLYTARWMADRGASVVLLCRDAASGEKARASLRRSANHRVVVCDLSVPDSVRAAAENVGQGSPLSGLVNNAAVLPRRRVIGPLGIELQMAVNHLGHFLLTRLLLPRLREPPTARVVTVASRSHRGPAVDLGDPGFDVRRYTPLVAYQQSKMANVAFTLALARRLEGSTVKSLAVHPGVYGTDLLGGWTGLGPLVRFAVPGPKQGGRWVGSLALGAGRTAVVPNGTYLEKGNRRMPAPAALDLDHQERLWRWSEGVLELDHWPPPEAGKSGVGHTRE
ncbi:MAG: SDR family NAD(P)-dependent oxidoreductase [Gemmatimonadota bacterium]|nr:SDR family NAD(P)-dependent oxidoreductase [Gemmatimonadota bacterium]